MHSSRDSNEFRRTSRCDFYKKLLESRSFPTFPIDKYDSSTFDFQQVLIKNDFRDPFLVLGEDDNFGIQLPPREWKLSDVAQVVGTDRKVRVIEVGTQSELNNFTLQQYADYLERNSLTNPNGVYRYAKILNMISLEFSDSRLSDFVTEPKFVRSIDWVRCLWPEEKMSRNDYPRVQKYCLAGMAGSYTDFHIDFGGTSVWYHILWGRKIFYLIPPTIPNLNKFEQWTCNAEQSEIFFGDLVDVCYVIELLPGQTLILPSGWIHSVYTPEDSLVFGGNFLHSYAILRQLQSYEIESRTKVDKVYMFPYFQHIHWLFLCELLPKAKAFYEERNYQIMMQYDKPKRYHILNTICSHVTQPGVFQQLPYLIKLCEYWIAESESQSYDEKEYHIIADRTKSRVKDVLIGWWTLLMKIVQANNPSPTNPPSTDDNTTVAAIEPSMQEGTQAKSQSELKPKVELGFTAESLLRIEQSTEYIDILNNTLMYSYHAPDSLPPVTPIHVAPSTTTTSATNKSSSLTLKIRKVKKPLLHDEDEDDVVNNSNNNASAAFTSSGTTSAAASATSTPAPSSSSSSLLLPKKRNATNGINGRDAGKIVLKPSKAKSAATTPVAASISAATTTTATTSTISSPDPNLGTRRTRGKRLSKDYLESVTGLAVHRDSPSLPTTANDDGADDPTSLLTRTKSYDYLEDDGDSHASMHSDEEDFPLEEDDVEEVEWMATKGRRKTATTSSGTNNKRKMTTSIVDEESLLDDKVIKKAKKSSTCKKQAASVQDEQFIFEPVKKSTTSKAAKYVDIRSQLLNKCKIGKKK